MDYMRRTILIVEDESSISNFMMTILNANNYHVLLAKTGHEAKMMISSYCPDVILLDLGLPDLDGIQIIQFVRKWSSTPIIVVSARTHEKEKVKALDLGADDYVTKPFATSELLARIRTAIRHGAYHTPSLNQAKPIFCAKGLMINYDKRLVVLNDKPIHLTQNEYKIVSLLSQYAGKVLTYEYMINHIWGPHNKGDNQILRVNMANIRRKIEVNPAQPIYIFTEVGVGYRMIEEDQ